MKRFLALTIITMLGITGIALADGCTITGTVVDADLAPVEGARVALQTADGCCVVVGTDAGGAYTFTEVEDGSYVVKASLRRVGNGLAEVEVAGESTIELAPIILGCDGGGGGGQGQGGGKQQCQQGPRG